MKSEVLLSRLSERTQGMEDTYTQRYSKMTNWNLKT
jgi:hypothetical protein